MVKSKMEIGVRRIRMSEARIMFLRAYEQTFGNISASCEFAGIHRSTLYRWLRSDSRVNLKFQRRFASLRPKERQKDVILGKFMQLVVEGVPAAVLYGMRTFVVGDGSNTESEDVAAAQLKHEAQRLKLAVAQRAEEKGITYREELSYVADKYDYIFKPEVLELLIEQSIRDRWM